MFWAGRPKNLWKMLLSHLGNGKKKYVVLSDQGSVSSILGSGIALEKINANLNNK
jgi:hypothetical protein